MARFCLALFQALGVTCASSAVAEEAPTDRQVTATVEQSLGFIQAKGVGWIEKRDCVSCHQVPFMVWSLNSAADRGLSVDAGELQAWSDWSTDWKNFVASKNRGGQKAEAQRANNVDVLYQLVLGRRPTESEQPWVETFRETLAATQQEDGSWKAGGQLPLQKRPKPETHDVTTMWALYALVRNQPSAVWQPLLEMAQPILKRTNDAASTEWWAVRLLLDDQLGHTDAADKARTKLLSSQRDDGGWGWLLDEQSDALGTGIALYALAKTGAADETAVGRARRFLISTQTDDGSWPVRSTKEAKRDRVTDTATYWGTCWAIIGLLETLGSQ